MYFRVCKSLTIDDVGEGGVCRGTPPYFRRCDRELVLKPAISLKKVGGATVERLAPQNEEALKRMSAP